MVNQVYTAIAKKLEEMYEEPVIFFDRLPQTFNGPCFWVRLLRTEQVQLLNNHYRVNLSFDVMLYPTSDDVFIDELNSAGACLLHGLEYITLDEGKLCRGTNISYEVQDGVLHFFVAYTLYTVVPYDRGVKMNKLIQQYKYKE